MNLLVRVLNRIRPRLWSQKQNQDSSRLQRAMLRVEDDYGQVLADRVAARRADYRLRVELRSRTVLVDLYWHYLMFAGAGGETVYQAIDHACNTYVKFGECIQEKRALHVSIRPVKR